MRVAQRTKSKKVLAQVVHSACALAQCAPPDPKLQDQVIQLALSHITTTKFIILVCDDISFFYLFIILITEELTQRQNSI